MAQRIKGQEVTIFVQNQGVPVASLTDIQNFSLTFNFDKLEEGYLGETFSRFDEVFKGANFDFEVHVEDPDFTKFVDVVYGRAIRRESATEINIGAILLFPSGRSRKILLKDCFFADVPVNVGGRTNYVSVKFSGSASSFEFL